MKKSNITKKTLLASILSFVVCVSLLIGTTMAWFTDNASAKVSDIQVGNLGILLLDADGNNVEDGKLDFVKSQYAPENEAILWEPGCTYKVPDVYVKNNGNLALKYKLSLQGIGDNKLAEVISFSINGEKLDENKEYHLMPGETSEPITISAHMDELAHNQYMNLTWTGVTVTVSASQDTVEHDSYDNWYDAQKQIVYQVIQSQDGDPDPDDNGAALGGYMAIKRHIAENPRRVEFLGFVYGDTTEQRQDWMMNGHGDSYHGSTGKANYEFYRTYTVPALKSVGCNTFYDTTPQTYNFNATELDQMTTSGKFVAEAVKNAIDKSTDAKEYRVVYSAGGGVNVPGEAIKYLENKGYSEEQIKEHFMVVQHSTFNYRKATEAAAQAIVNPFYTAIADQNAYTGPNKGLPPYVSVAKTSEEFAKAWAIAVGGEEPVPPIDEFGSFADISDAGSHSFASNPKVLDKYWNTRSNGIDDKSNRVPYSEYNAARVKAELCD